MEWNQRFDDCFPRSWWEEGRVEVHTGSPSSQRKHDSGGRESEFTMISHDLEATTSVVSTASVFYDLEATITVVVFTASVFYELHVLPVSVRVFVFAYTTCFFSAVA